MAIGTARITLTDLIRQDHTRLKDLFGDFERADDEGKKTIAREALRLIQIHDRIEKKLLYPNALKSRDVPREAVLRAQEAHHLANVLISELSVMPYGERWSAKFEKLVGAIREHIEEEEGELLPAVERGDLDLVELGGRMEDMRDALESRAVLRPAAAGAGAFAVAAAAVGVGWLVYRAVSRKD